MKKNNTPPVEKVKTSSPFMVGLKRALMAIGKEVNIYPAIGISAKNFPISATFRMPIRKLLNKWAKEN